MPGGDGFPGLPGGVFDGFGGGTGADDQLALPEVGGAGVDGTEWVVEGFGVVRVGRADVGFALVGFALVGFAPGDVLDGAALRVERVGFGRDAWVDEAWPVPDAAWDVGAGAA